MTYVANSSKQGKTTKLIKVQWIASIGCLNDQNNAKLQKCSKYNELHRLDVKTIKTTQNSKNDQNTMTCIDLITKRSKQHKTTKAIELLWIASIWRQNDQNNAKLQKQSNYDQFAFNRRLNDQNVELRRKTFKTMLNYKSAQNTMTCIDLMTKRSKQRNTTRTIDDEFHRFDDKTF